MKQFQELLSYFSDFLWGYPLIFLFLGAGIFLTVYLGFLPFRHTGLIFKKTIGQIGRKTATITGITPFQAFTSALSATAGATNIVGVPVAIAFGGPGALFWMWVVALIGMSTLYAEIVLGITYRKKRLDGSWTGGPLYYLSQGLKWGKTGYFYAFGLMLEVIPSIMVQSNSISSSLQTEFDIQPLYTGLFLFVLTLLVVWGGIKRIGKVSSVLLPAFVIVYMIITFYVISRNFIELGPALLLILKSAFTRAAPLGIFAGSSVVNTIRWGLARGLYTSEAGMGTSAIAHASSNTKEAPEQAFWGMIAVVMDTLVICTLTGLTVIITGVWRIVPTGKAASMVAKALTPIFGPFWSSSIVSILLIFFVMATVGVIIYYGECQAEILFGKKVKVLMRIIYFASIVIGAAGGLKIVWEFLDLLLALIVVPNIIGILFLSRKVKKVTSDYLQRAISPSGTAEKENHSTK